MKYLRAFALGIVGAATFALLFLVTRPSTVHHCNAPCTVILPDNTQEDEFGINYGWRDHETPIVDVYQTKPNHG